MLTEQQIDRYSRQIILPQVGGRGQQRLLSTSIAVVGAGGVGSAAAIYLAAAGVGTLTVVDAETVQPSDLYDAVAYTTARLGEPRAESVAAELGSLNPDCRIAPLTTPLTTAAASSVVQHHDVLIDASAAWDVSTRLNAACLHFGKLLVWGAAIGCEGRTATFAGHLPDAPCYRCMHPEPPDEPALAAGRFNVAAGFIGTLLATEAIKIALGMGATLSGRTVIYEALTGVVRAVSLSRNPQCMTCSVAHVSAPLDTR